MILKVAFRNLRRHLRRTIITLVAIALTFTVISPPAVSEDGDPPAEGETVAVAFVTNRAKIDGRGGPERYGNEAGPLRYVTCEVEFDPLGFLKDAARHISLRFPTEMEDIVTLEEKPPETFWSQFAENAGAEGRTAAWCRNCLLRSCRDRSRRSSCCRRGGS